MAAAFTVLTAAGVAEAATSTDLSAPVRIPARILEDRLVVVPVSVSGRGPYSFLLDTGSSVSIVDEGLARELDLPVAGTTLAETATSARPGDLVEAVLSLGRVERAGAVLRAPLRTLQRVDGAIRGVVGQDLLRQANWWLDYRGRAVFEDSGGSLARALLGERLALVWDAGRPAIDTSLPSRRPLRLVLDSAASSPVLFRDLPDAMAEPLLARLTTAGDDVAVRMASVGPLRAGRALIPRLQVAILGGTATPRAEDGLLPTALFEGLYFDNRASTVVLEPRRSSLSVAR